MEEIWKKIPNHEYYEVSNLGSVRSIDRVVIEKSGKKRLCKGRILKLRDNGQGYKKLVYKDALSGEEYVHRLVARLFIPNPMNKPCVNHIDNNPSNNSVKNLEWVTKQENTNWMIKQGRAVRTKTWLDRLNKSLSKVYKPVKATELKSGNTLFFSHINAVKELGFSSSCVCSCCKGNYKQYKGYKWEYITNEEYEKHNT